MNRFLIVFATFFLAVALLSGTGCEKKAMPPATAVKTAVSKMETLPTGAAKFKDVGNDWMTFELDVAGKKRHFLIGRFKKCQTVPTLLELQK